jgi:uncharacterized membrane protein
VSHLQVLKIAKILQIAALLTPLAACGPTGGDGSDTLGSCPNDLPKTCPAAPPSYTTEVQPLIARHCLQCHGPGGIADARRDFSTYAHVAAQQSIMLDQVYACLMPPANGTPLDPNERQTLLQWLVCHAPNN